MVNLSTYHPGMFRDQRPFPQGVLFAPNCVESARGKAGVAS
jgi:hypothetical protein